MSETETAIKSVAHGAEDLGKEFIHILAEYAAPILGILMGFWGAYALGGGYTIGNALNSMFNKSNDPSMYPTINIVAGAILGGLFGLAGAAMWGIGARKKDATAPSSSLVMGVSRFFAGLFFGLAIGNLVAGFKNNPTAGAIENWSKGVGIQTGQ